MQVFERIQAFKYTQPPELATILMRAAKQGIADRIESVNPHQKGLNAVVDRLNSAKIKSLRI